jgi:pantoate--beta-alanine ligase
MVTDRTIEIVRTLDALRTRLATWREAGARVGLVPTMGALHEGHFSLVDRAVSETDQVCASIFVNPKQFGPTEDFSRYPRDENGDCAALQAHGVNLIYMPTADEMYPDGFATSVTVPGIADRLEGACRPGFFTGVATVVTKLLLQVRPDVAYFGEKDFQQLCVIRRMVTDLDIDVEIGACPTIREDDGLALSSRNAYLSQAERAAAPTLYRALLEIQAQLKNGVGIVTAVGAGHSAMMAAGFTHIDYLSVYDPTSFAECDAPAAESRILAAAWLGKTRLIDNIAL